MEDEPLYDIDERDEKIDNPEVLKKYKQAGSICTNVLKQFLTNIKPGQKIIDLCEKCDSIILSMCADVVTPKTERKGKNDLVDEDYQETKKAGIAYPTCISTGRIIANFSPEKGDNRVVQKGDEVRVEFGVHVDGYISMIGTSMFLEVDAKETTQNQMSDENQMESKEEDDLIKAETPEIFEERSKAIFCARKVLELTKKAMKPGNSNIEIGKLTNELLKKFGVFFAKGILSHEISRYVIDGSNVILHNPTEYDQVFEFKFKKNEVYCIDIAITTNPEFKGRVREEDYNPLILKREVLDHSVFLKNESSTKLIRHIDENFDNFPFALRDIPLKSRMGLNELKQKGFITPLPVLYRRKNDCFVRLIATILITEDEVVQLTEPFFQTKYLKYQPKVNINHRDLQNVKKVLTE